MNSAQKQTADYIATVSAELAALAESSGQASLAYVLRMAELEARHLNEHPERSVKAAA